MSVCADGVGVAAFSSARLFLLHDHLQSLLVIQSRRFVGKEWSPCIDFSLARRSHFDDRSMVEAAGLGVAFHAKPDLAEIADATLYHSDLTALLALQGIAESEYA